jgi:hypothetical protein
MAKNTLEHHAVLTALLAKHAIESAGERGKEAFIAGVTRLGMERGTRMAARAILRGGKLNLASFQAYGEWRADEGVMDFVTESLSPVCLTRARKCGWNDAWRKHGLLEWGKYFCLTIDDALARGFSAELGCSVRHNMSWGAPDCEFDWKIALTQKEAAWVSKKKAELGTACIKDFDYHTGHVLHSVAGEIAERLSAQGQDIVDRALADFAAIFGSDCIDAAKAAYSKGEL